MASTLTITDCTITSATTVSITFSDQVDGTSITGDTSATNPANYTVYDPDGGLWSPANPKLCSLDATNQTVTMTINPPAAFNPGDFVLVSISNIALASAPGASALISDPVTISRQVPSTDSTGRTTKDVEDAIAYPILTEEVAYRPSPVGIPTTGAGGIAGPGTSSLGQVALQAVSDVLGWKANPSDPKGFIGALTQSFTLTDVEGHTEASWKPRTYAVQTDLGGGITGAQASLYMRAKDALDKSLPLLDGLYPLDPEADPEYVKALREMARSQMTEIIKELGTVGLPSILRIDTYFNIVLGQSNDPVEFEPDFVRGTLGQLRDTYGIFFRNNKLSNSVEDEQDITNFRVISDYMTSLLQSWISNRDFFRLGTANQAFFGTQLVLISRQFNVITETVNELRFALDSVFIGPSERQTLLLEFPDGTAPMFLEDVLVEVESFATDEGPRLLRDGGRISVTNNILPVVQSLQNLVEQAHDPTNFDVLPDGFKTARVRNAIDDLNDQLEALINLIQQVEQEVPQPEGKPIITGVSTPQLVTGTTDFLFSIFGDGFEAGLQVEIESASATVVKPVDTQFYSAQRVDVTLHLDWLKDTSNTGSHDVTVTNPEGGEYTFANAFTYDATVQTFKAAVKLSTPGRRVTTALRFPTGKSRPVVITAGGIGGQPVPPAPPAPPPGPGTPTSPAVTQQLTALQTKYEALNKGLTDLQTSQNSLSQKIDDVQKSLLESMNYHLAEAKKTHEGFMEEIKGWFAKKSGSGEEKK